MSYYTPESRVRARKRLLTYGFANRGKYLLGLLLLIATNGLNITYPWLSKYAIDLLRGGAEPSRILPFVIGMILAAIGAMIFRTVSRIVVFNAGRDIEYDMRNHLFAHLQKLPQSFYARIRTGDVMSRLTNDLTGVRLLTGPGVLNVVNTPISYGMTLFAMALIDPKLTLWSLIPFPLLLLIARRFGRSLHDTSLRTQVELSSFSSLIQENLSGQSVVRAYAREDTEAKKFEGANERLYWANLGLARVSSLMMPVVSTVPGLGLLIVLFAGGRHVVGGELSLGGFIAFSLYVFQLTWPTFILGWVLSMVQRGLSGMNRLNEIFETVPSIRDDDRTRPIETLAGSITFRDLDFSYPATNGAADGRDGAGRPVLRRISLDVPAGSSLAIVGHTGSGKSTLASLVPHLYEVEEGKILLDGHDLHEIPIATLRRQIAFAPQEAFLFSMSVRDNIRFGKPAATEAEVEEAATLAGVIDDIREFPNGLDTVVGERGFTLSGGQRQRVALARALLLDPKVLILDDSLSSVDTQTEERILGHLREFKRGRTLILISHRVSTVKDADQIVVLEEGEILERGSHAELLVQSGVYASMYQEQLVERSLEEE
ncbi:MAG: ABC transporter ATP-binding protein [Deltaproteobacteria bacterium]|nr:ABC transporter ATP-binding protein [Deltaproteobacteria bacterium]